MAEREVEVLAPVPQAPGKAGRLTETVRASVCEAGALD
jgi:hypothetical protein